MYTEKIQVTRRLFSACFQRFTGQLRVTESRVMNAGLAVQQMKQIQLFPYGLCRLIASRRVLSIRVFSSNNHYGQKGLNGSGDEMHGRLTNV